MKKQHARKPMVRMVIPPATDIQIPQLVETYRDRILLSFRRTGTVEPVPAGISIEAQRLSVQELGRALLGSHFEQEQLNSDRCFQIFELLSEGRLESAAKLLEEGLTDLNPPAKG